MQARGLEYIYFLPYYKRIMEKIAKECAELLCAKKWKLVTAESCTGGLIAAQCTNIPGSSDWFAGSIVAYSNNVKLSLLGVAGDILKRLGAVSEEVVIAMAKRALPAIGGHISVAVSGIAGPDGGTEQKPVGTVWICWATLEGYVRAEKFYFEGSRAEIREQTVQAALEGIASLLR